MALYVTKIILLFILFEKITFSFLGKKKIVLGFYRVVKTVVTFKVVLTKTLCIFQLVLCSYLVLFISGIWQILIKAKNMSLLELLKYCV